MKKELMFANVPYGSGIGLFTFNHRVLRPFPSSLM